jgi:hypothetical protein
MDINEWRRMTPAMRQKYVEIVRSIPSSKKLRITMEWCDAMRAMMAAGIRAQNPGISDEDVRKEIIKRTLPPDLVKKVYGW